MRQRQSFTTLQQRKDTFLRRGRFRWPYIKYSSYLAQPETLASAGFSFNPVKDAPDNVQCFMCGFELTGWEATDDPFAEHYAHEPTCPYARLHCQVRAAREGNKVEWVGWPAEASQDLTAEQRAAERQKVMDLRADVQMRIETFEACQWPHEGEEGWNLTPDKLARAGFYFTPGLPGDDTATCAFCGYALTEWEPDDDPNAEHARRSADCLFFRLDGADAWRRESAASPEATKKRGEPEAVVVVDSGDEGAESDASAASKRQRLSEVGRGQPSDAAETDDNSVGGEDNASDRSGGPAADPHQTNTQLTDTQLTDTQVGAASIPASPGNMAIDEAEHTQYATQVGPVEAGPEQQAGDEWDLDEDEAEMTVEEFILACCDQKTSALEASAGQMVDAFMKRAESTRERICSLPW
ncbi:hypothetical protein GGF46_000540 [Coemansia sp. RSA 552]|nr:hypothetical protein GGF46_000540 [Coemansia sp. RSA 552]